LYGRANSIININDRNSGGESGDTLYSGGVEMMGVDDLSDGCDCRLPLEQRGQNKSRDIHAIIDVNDTISRSFTDYSSLQLRYSAARTSLLFIVINQTQSRYFSISSCRLQALNSLSLISTSANTSSYKWRRGSVGGQNETSRR
jgi:hypothetical protein